MQDEERTVNPYMTNKMVSILGKGNTIDLEKLKSLLDDEQVQAVTKGYDNLLVKANAGSGKTRVLTSRVAYLLGSGVPESHIMLLTFTRKASREMMERVEAMLGGRKVRILGGTFHSIGATFLRKYAGLLGYDYRFTILDTEDARKLINDIRKVYLKREGLSNKDFPTAKLIYHYGSSAINKNMTLEEINMLNNNLNEYMLDGVREILEAYTKRKKDANGMDFD
ncbi:MAG TPA: UvrD-helicase domain-containing protein, partial [Pseudoneobacillus sp.]|nr:UvrD-helicase domain-containing protein [Pseudoneobacillus sp.]